MRFIQQRTDESVDQCCGCQDAHLCRHDTEEKKNGGGLNVPVTLRVSKVFNEPYHTALDVKYEQSLLRIGDRPTFIVETSCTACNWADTICRRPYECMVTFSLQFVIH